MTSNDKYNELTRGKSELLNISIVAHIPVPNDVDYKRGYINRYFAQRSNDSNSPIYEVTDVDYRKLHSSPMYNITNLRWRITGPIEPTRINAGEVVDKGVKESNKISIKIASDLIHKLGLYLPNLRQFYQS